MRAALLVICSTAFAGQLHIQHYTLGDVAKDGGAVLVGKVLSVQPTKPRGRSIELELTAVFGPSDRKPGEKVKLEEYPGVEWTDPHKSPMDRRVQGQLSEGKPGAMVAAVPAPFVGSEKVTLLESDPGMLRRLTLLYDPARHPKEPTDKLRADLGDAELAAVARAELQKRHQLTVEDLVRGEDRSLEAHYRALPPKERRAFAQSAVKIVLKDPKLRDRVAELLFRQPDPTPSLAQLAKLFDPKKEEELQKLDDLRDELLNLDGKFDLSPLADFLVAWEVHRPRHKSDDQDLPKLTAHLSRAAKIRVAIGLLENAYTTVDKPDDGPDDLLLDEAARLAEEAPSAELLPALARVDAARPAVTSTKEGVMAQIIRIALALKAPPKARAIVEGWLKKNVPVADEDRKKWRKATR